MYLFRLHRVFFMAFSELMTNNSLQKRKKGKYFIAYFRCECTVLSRLMSKFARSLNKILEWYSITFG